MIPGLLPAIPPMSVTEAAFSVVSKSVMVVSVLISDKSMLLCSAVKLTRLRLTEPVIQPSLQPAIPPAKWRPFTRPFVLQPEIIPVSSLVPAIPPTRSPPVIFPVQ